MSETQDIMGLFMDSLDPQARFNMEVAVKLDELLRADGGHDEVTDELLEVMSTEIQELREAQSRLEREMKILRGALEETVLQLREYQRGQREAPKETPAVDPQRVVQEAQSRATGLTPSGRRSKAKRFKGTYCRNCGTALKTKNQTIFCSRKCAAQWKAQHPDQQATPRMALDDKNGFSATVEAGAGVKKGSVAA